MTTLKQKRSLRRKRRNEQRKERNQVARKATAHRAGKNVRHMAELEFLLERGRQNNKRYKSSDYKGGISPRHYEAGDRLYRDFRASGSLPQIVPRYDREIGLPPTASFEAQIDARRRYDLAMQAAGTRLHRAVLVHVCLVDQKLAGWVLPASRGLEILREALDRLAEWYEGERRAEMRVLEVA